jgi:hypothetical protein
VSLRVQADLLPDMLPSEVKVCPRTNPTTMGQDWRKHAEEMSQAVSSELGFVESLPKAFLLLSA